jgi:1-aminocyclopropane-1-carboxylate deaminase
MVQLPQSFADIPRVDLLFPQPPIIYPLEKLQATFNSPIPEIWICREDCNSGLASGGNKLRKLEYVISDALHKKADVLVTAGGVQSNHMRQTAAAAAYCGLKVNSLL